MTEKQCNRWAFAFYGMTILNLVAVLVFPAAKFFWLGAAGFYVAAISHRFMAGQASRKALLKEVAQASRVRDLRP